MKSRTILIALQLIICIESVKASDYLLFTPDIGGVGSHETEWGLSKLYLHQREQALIDFEKSDSIGSSFGTYFLSYLLEEKEEVDKSMVLLMKSAQADCFLAKYTLGEKYRLGHSVKKDLSQAKCWLEKARKNGFVGGSIALYFCYGELNMPDKEFVIAKEIYEKEGLPIFLAQQYLFGRGCEQNLEIVYNMLGEMANGKLEFTRPDGGRINCEKRSQYEAQLYMGVANYFDKSKTNHYEEAVRWLQSVVNSKDAADSDRGKAMCLLQRCYRFGRGVDKDVNKANELEQASHEFLSEDEIYKFSSQFSASY